jgi:hypothetical protein
LNVHMPYSLPVASFLISTVPPVWPQATDAGFAIPTDVCVAVAVVVLPAGVLMHPVARIAARMSREPAMKRYFLGDIICTENIGR